jgi:hypothetical protein
VAPRPQLAVDAELDRPVLRGPRQKAVLESPGDLTSRAYRPLTGTPGARAIYSPPFPIAQMEFPTDL